MPVTEVAVSATKRKSNGKEQPAGVSGDDGATRPAKRKRLTPSAKRRVASAVTSGRRLFVLGDGNSAWSRRYADLVRLHAQDVCGGLDLSQAQQSLIRRAAAIECELELLEGRLSLGQPVDLDVFTRSASHLRRILETLGIRRVPREIDPGLDTYLTTSKHHDGREVVDVTTQPAGGTLSPQPDASEASESSEAEPEGAA